MAYGRNNRVKRILQIKYCLILILFIFVLSVKSNSRADEIPMASRIEVTILLFSGRPDPYFVIDNRNDIATIYQKTLGLSRSENGMDVSCPSLGYRGFLLGFYSGEKPLPLPDLRVCKGVIEISDKQYLKDEKDLEDFLKEQASQISWKNMSKEAREKIVQEFFLKKESTSLSGK